MSSHLPLLPYINPFNLYFSFHISPTKFLKLPSPSQNCSPSSPTMAKTRRAHSFRPRVRQSPTPPVGTSTPGVVVASGPSAAATRPPASAASPAAAATRPSAVAAASPAPAAVQGAAVADAKGCSSVAPAQRRYHTRVCPTSPAPSHPRPARRAPPPKRAQTSGPEESSTSRPQTPPSPPYQGIARAPDLSPASIIKRPFFHCSPIQRNVDCNGRDLHGEVYYDLPAFSKAPELQDSMLLVQRYHVDPFMTPRRYFYPQVVIKFYHTMTSRCEANPTALHFSIDGRPGILRASDITAALHLVVVLVNVADYRQWPHPSTREIVRLLSMDATSGTILFRRHLQQRMLLIDHILRSNLFPLQHIVKRRGVILEALYHISEGFLINSTELIMTSLFHFEDRVHHRSLPHTESMPLLFPRLLCQVLEHIGFSVESLLERRCGYDATLTIDRWQAMPRAFHLPPPGPDEDELAANSPLGDMSPIAEHTEEPSASAPSVPPSPPTTAPGPPAPMSSIPSKPSTLCPLLIQT